MESEEYGTGAARPGNKKEEEEEDDDSGTAEDSNDGEGNDNDDEEDWDIGNDGKDFVTTDGRP